MLSALETSNSTCVAFCFFGDLCHFFSLSDRCLSNLIWKGKKALFVYSDLVYTMHWTGMAGIYHSVCIALPCMWSSSDLLPGFLSSYTNSLCMAMLLCFQCKGTLPYLICLAVFIVPLSFVLPSVWLCYFFRYVTLLFHFNTHSPLKFLCVWSPIASSPSVILLSHSLCLSSLSLLVCPLSHRTSSPSTSEGTTRTKVGRFTTPELNYREWLVFSQLSIHGRAVCWG